MRFITPSYKILSEDFTRENVLKKIEKAARVCYQSEGSICEGSDAKIVNKLIRLGHEAMIEHAPSLSVSVITCRGVTHEIVRNRLFSFAQESTRYCKYGKGGEPMLFILPPWIDGEDRHTLLSSDWSFEPRICTPCNGRNENDFLAICVTAEQTYKDMLSRDWTPQQAREILPNALKTEIVITGNVRQWRHFFFLRCDKPAHPQMREWTIPLFNELRADIPELWDDIAAKIDLTI